MIRRPPRSTLFPYTDALPIWREAGSVQSAGRRDDAGGAGRGGLHQQSRGRSETPDRRVSDAQDRKSTRLNSSHSQISYAVFCLKKKKPKQATTMKQTASTHTS